MHARLSLSGSSALESSQLCLLVLEVGFGQIIGEGRGVNKDGGGERKREGLKGKWEKEAGRGRKDGGEKKARGRSRKEGGGKKEEGKRNRG